MNYCLTYVTCDITITDQWPTVLTTCSMELNVNTDPPLFFPFPAMQIDKLRLNLYGNHYHSTRKALQNKVLGPANPTDFLPNKTERMHYFKRCDICTEEMNSPLLICELD